MPYISDRTHKIRNKEGRILHGNPKCRAQSPKKSLATILKDAHKDASRDDLCTIEGIDSATGKPFTMDFEDLMNGTDTIQKAVERCNPPE